MCNTQLKWAPDDWKLAHFPLSDSDCEIINMEAMVESLLAHIQGVTEADTTPLCQTLHTAHMLRTLQGDDGRWPCSLNARTGKTLTEERTSSPVRLFRRLNDALNSTEFDSAIEYEGGSDCNG